MLLHATGIPGTRPSNCRHIVAIMVIYPGVHKSTDERIYFLLAAAIHCWRRAIREETRLAGDINNRAGF